ncbi:MAG: autotransporter-associated beta strand repeat-containing protein [Pirellulales bacterium]|nr:autotransporter-associated beta strand repeat-containing protein [Pirellulales bacterium]
MSRLLKILCFSALVYCLLAMPAHALNYYFDNDNSDYDFTNPVNWSNNTYPGASDYGIIQNNSYADISSAAPSIGKLYVGANQGGALDPPLTQGTGVLNILTGGSLTTASTCYIGEGTDNQGTVNVNGGSLATGSFGLGYGSGCSGTLNVSNGGSYSTTTYLYVGRNSGALGTVNLSGSTSSITTAGYEIRVGYESGATGVINQSGGTFTVGNALRLGMAASSIGAVHQTGGTTNTTSAIYAGLANSAYGYYDLAGGSLNTYGLSLGAASGSVGVAEQSAGTTITTGTYGIRAGAATNGISLFNQKGGTVNCNRVLWAGGNYSGAWGQIEVAGTINVVSSEYTSVGRNPASKGYLNLQSGGTLVTPLLYTYADTASGGEAFLNFHGGTLKANASTTDPADPATHFVRMPSAAGGIFLGAEGGAIDTDGYDVVISDPVQALTGWGVSDVEFTEGEGYYGPPVVQITGGNGRGATAVATVAGGVVTGITVTNPGTGYAEDDVLTVTLVGGGSTTAATVTGVTLAANTVDGGLVKSGLGKLTLAGASTYVGLTDVAAGALSVTGSLAGDVQVQAGASLLGTGTIGGDVSGLAASTIAPGTSIGALVVSGDAALAGVLDIEFDSSTDEIDVLAVTGQLNLTGGSLQFSDLASEPVPLDQPAYVFATYGTLVGDLPTVGPLPDGYQVDFAYGGNSIALVVPEPGMLALALGLVFGVLYTRRGK